MSADIASRRLSRPTPSRKRRRSSRPAPMKASTDSVALSLFNLMFSRSSLRVVDSNSSSRASLRAISPGLSGPTS